MSKEQLQCFLKSIGNQFSVDEILKNGLENYQSTSYKPVQKDNGLWNIVKKDNGFITCFNYSEHDVIKQMALYRKYQR